MKGLLRNIALFIFPLIGLMFLADWFLSSQLRHSRDDEYSVWNDIYYGRINSDVVIYGSSRAMVHLDPKIIRDSLHVSTYNLGINGHNFWLQYYRHKELLDHNKKPGFIIHSVDIFTLAKRKDLFNMEQFLPYMLYDRDLEKWISSYDGFNRYDFNVPLIRYYGQFKTIGRAIRSLYSGQESGDSSRFRGFSAQNLQWNDDLEKAKREFPNYKASVDPKTVILFDRYLRECTELNIPVVLVYSPEYKEGQDFVRNRDEIMNIFSVFAAKYNIPFIDYSNDSISYKKEYFYNSSHLNAAGAQLFTSKLIHDIKKNDRITHLVYSSINRNSHQASMGKIHFKYWK